MIEIGALVWGVRDLKQGIEFWTSALGYRVEGEPSDDWANLLPVGGDGGVKLALKLATSESPRRHHLDLLADDQGAEVERLLALGATRVADWDYEDDADYVVLHDPDGNAFCVVQR